MSQFRNFINLLGNIGINSSEAMDLISKNEYFYHIAHYKKILSNNQFGGAKKKSIIYNNKKYVFYKTIDDDRIIYTLNSQNEGIHDCIIIYIDKHKKTAYIETMGNNKGCIIIGKIEHAGGSILMKISLKLIKKMKDKYNLEYVYLTDNAHKTLFDDKGKAHSVKLSNLMFLTQGITYYEKFGFKPVRKNEDIVSYSDDITKKYKETKATYLKAKVKDITINYKSLIKDVGNEKEHLIKNIKNKLDSEIGLNLNVMKVIAHYSKNTKYISIINSLMESIILNNNVYIPKLWGMKL